MNRKQLLKLFTPSFLTAFQQKLFISILTKLPIQQGNKKMLFQFKASAILAGMQEKPSYEELQREMLSFIQKTYNIDTSNQLIQINIISQTKFIKGKGIIEVEVNAAIIPYLQALKQHFSLSTLKSIIQFRSIYSINIYLLLDNINNGQTIVYSILELKRILGIEERYKDYNTFKNRVILQAQKELHLTDKAFLFEEKKEGKKVVDIVFKVYSFDQLYWSKNKKYLVEKLIKDLNISEPQASKIVFQFVEEEIYNIIYEIKEKERAGLIKTSLGAFSVSFFNQKKQ